MGRRVRVRSPRATWIVQARPATGRGFPEGGDATRCGAASTSARRCPGVATPLTWSVAGAFSEAGFRRAFAALGCSVPQQRAPRRQRARPLLPEPHRSSCASPRRCRGSIRARSSISAEARAATSSPRRSRTCSKRGFYARLPLTAARLVGAVRLDDNVGVYEQDAEKQSRAHSALDLAILPDDGARADAPRHPGSPRATGTVMLTCASSALGAHLALKALLARVAPLGADRLAQALTSGIRDLESARPAIGIMRVASLARSEPEARAALETRDDVGLDAIPKGRRARALAELPRALRRSRGARGGALDAALERGPAPGPHDAPRGRCRDEAPASRRRPRLARARKALRRRRDGAALMPRLEHRRADARAPPRRARAEGRAPARADAGVGHARPRDAARGRARRRPAPPPPRRRSSAADWRALVDAGAPLASVRGVSSSRSTRSSQALRDVARRSRRRSSARDAPSYARDLRAPDPPATFVGAPPAVVLPPSGGDVMRGLAGERGRRRRARARAPPPRRNGRSSSRARSSSCTRPTSAGRRCSCSPRAS